MTGSEASIIGRFFQESSCLPSSEQFLLFRQRSQELQEKFWIMLNSCSGFYPLSQHRCFSSGFISCFTKGWKTPHPCSQLEVFRSHGFTYPWLCWLLLILR